MKRRKKEKRPPRERGRANLERGAPSPLRVSKEQERLRRCPNWFDTDKKAHLLFHKKRGKKEENKQGNGGEEKLIRVAPK